MNEEFGLKRREEFYQIIGFRISNHGLVEKEVDSDDGGTSRYMWCAPNANDVRKIAEHAFQFWLSNRKREKALWDILRMADDPYADERTLEDLHKQLLRIVNICGEGLS